jgi:hypothetical protein
LAGICDINYELSSELAEKYDTTAYESLDGLIENADIVDIVTPTTTHYDIAKKVLESGKHLFIEKPVTNTVDEAKSLLEMSQERNLKIQVGHVERYNPAYLALKDIDLRPMFIEGHRLAEFNPRGTDVSVILDLMIHDLDLILTLVGSKVIDVQANGVSIVSPTHDICNARLRFENGSVVNLTASRISMKQMRKLRLFQPDAYISMDFLEKESQIIQLHEVEENTADDDILHTARGPKRITISVPPIPGVNAIKEELSSFAECIMKGTTPEVSIKDGYEALKLAYDIIEACDRYAEGI